MKMLLLSLTFLFSLFTTTASEDHRLEVRLAGLDSSDGTVRICLMNDAGQFLKDCYVGQVYDFKKDQGLKVVFDDLPTGEYAIMAFHDEDGNGALNCEGLFGMPSEPYAFSNNPSTFFGPPSHKKCVFRVEKDKKVTIKF